jgi:hypothetical protein
MFQPGEEGLHGARVMIEEGLLGDPPPDAAFALHIWPTLPFGTVACRAGAILASTDMLHARIVGEGGHAAMPHEARDPVPVAAEVVLALQSEVARRSPVADPIVLSITKINAGTTHNVLPEAVEMLGTLRALSPEARTRGQEAFERICTHVAAAHGCTAEVKIEPGYPPTVNDRRAVRLVREIAGDAFLKLPASNMCGEDFSYVLDRDGLPRRGSGRRRRGRVRSASQSGDDDRRESHAAGRRAPLRLCHAISRKGLGMIALLLALAEPASVGGFYRSNQTEVGAALQLDEDGRFQYQLDYGAVSESAEGSWTSDGKTILLTATKMEGAYKTSDFNREPLKIEGDRLLLVRYDTVIRFDREELPAPADKK